MESKEMKTAEKFLLKSKQAFAEKIPRNKLSDITVTECVRDEAFQEAARFRFTGAVGAASSTGKLRTYQYHATVDVKEKDAEIVDLEVLPIEG